MKNMIKNTKKNKKSLKIDGKTQMRKKIEQFENK
jgi:hypothetical protein